MLPWEVLHRRLPPEGTTAPPDRAFEPGLPDGPPPGRGVDLVWVRVGDRDPPAGQADPLSAAERARAARFRVAHPRRLFTAGRWTLRHWLGRVLRCPPEGVPLRLSETGKPEIDLDSPAAPRWEFNLSHSGSRILAGLQRQGGIGVDVEEIRPRRMLEAIAEDYYHPAEQALLGGGGDAHTLDAFYRCWTLKEAYIKAIGEGLRYPIRTLDFSAVAAAPVGAATDVAIDGRPWRCLSLPVDPGYAAAVIWEPALPGQDRRAAGSSLRAGRSTTR